MLGVARVEAMVVPANDLPTIADAFLWVDPIGQRVLDGNHERTHKVQRLEAVRNGAERIGALGIIAHVGPFLTVHAPGALPLAGVFTCHGSTGMRTYGI